MTSRLFVVASVSIGCLTFLGMHRWASPFLLPLQAQCHVWEAPANTASFYPGWPLFDNFLCVLVPIFQLALQSPAGHLVSCSLLPLAHVVFALVTVETCRGVAPGAAAGPGRRPWIRTTLAAFVTLHAAQIWGLAIAWPLLWLPAYLAHGDAGPEPAALLRVAHLGVTVLAFVVSLLPSVGMLLLGEVLPTSFFVWCIVAFQFAELLPVVLPVICCARRASVSAPVRASTLAAIDGWLTCLYLACGILALLAHGYAAYDLVTSMWSGFSAWQHLWLCFRAPRTATDYAILILAVDWLGLMAAVALYLARQRGARSVLTFLGVSCLASPGLTFAVMVLSREQEKQAALLEEPPRAKPRPLTSVSNHAV